MSLNYNHRNYEPVSVVCGPTYTAVIGKINLDIASTKTDDKNVTDGNPYLGTQKIFELSEKAKNEKG